MRLLLAVSVSLCVVSVAAGQVRLRDDPRTVALAQMHRVVTAELDEAALEDVVTYLEQETGVTLEPAWLDESSSGVGLDREALVSMTARDETALAFLERVLDKVDDEFDAATWQVTDAGTIEIGPRSALNRRAHVKIYDVQDLLIEAPGFTDVPDLQLGRVVQGQGGSNQNVDLDVPNERSEAERLESLISLIQTSVEFDQWRENGGDAASIAVYQSALLVRAPGYIHRQLGGYEFWPTEAEVRRYSSR